LTDDNSNNNNLVDMDDLDAFETEFFQQEPAEEKKVTEEVVEESNENEDDHLAPDDEDEAEAEEAEGEEEDEESDPEPEPKPKPKSKAQQRIEKLLERERLANERAEALEKRLSALEASNKPEATQEEQAPALRDQLPADAPNPDALDKDGNPVYALGEFDPKFIRDITKYTITQEMNAKQEREQQEARERMVAEQRQVIQDKWLEKLEAAEEETPDIRESISDLVDTFQNVEPAYGEYLASVLMSSDAGPQIMYYLSQNIGEAQKIVASGPAAATLAIGRLEARLAPTEAKEEKRNTKRVSDAPPPPENRSRGSGGKFAVSPDTDDLDAFEREFFKRP
jgi:hypothetical protein